MLSINLCHTVTKWLSPLPASIWKQTQAGQPRIPIPTKSKPRDILCYSPAPKEYLDQGKWLETAGPCNEFLLALGQSKSNQPCSDSWNRWMPSVCSPLLHTPRASTGLGRSSRDMHIYLKGHKSQNYSFIINCILFFLHYLVLGQNIFHLWKFI